MTRESYIETFDDGPGGWVGWVGGGGGPVPLERAESAVGSRSPWGVDVNHAPPGTGYLHLLFILMTTPGLANRPKLLEPGGPNRFVDGGYSRDLTNARMTLCLKGDLNRRGSQLMLLAQGDVAATGVRGNHVLLAQPFDVTPDWTEQTVTLEPDAAQWLSLGVREAGADSGAYGHSNIADVLRDVNVDLLLVLFPIQAVPAEPIDGDPHHLRAGIDYPVRADRLPEGEVWLDEVRIEYA